MRSKNISPANTLHMYNGVLLHRTIHVLILDRVDHFLILFIKPNKNDNKTYFNCVIYIYVDCYFIGFMRYGSKRNVKVKIPQSRALIFVQSCINNSFIRAHQITKTNVIEVFLTHFRGSPTKTVIRTDTIKCQFVHSSEWTSPNGNNDTL